jgi:uncharacterized membrane protein YcaP (DUF421 family)
MSLPWWEFVARAISVYFFILLILRLSGKRQVAQLSPFDFVLLLILSNAVQNSINGGDNSLVGGMISAFVLVTLNWLVGYAVFRNKKIENLVDGTPEILIHNGKLNEHALLRQKISHHDLDTILRQNNCIGIGEVRFALIEPNGHISVIKKPTTTHE